MHLYDDLHIFWYWLYDHDQMSVLQKSLEYRIFTQFSIQAGTEFLPSFQYKLAQNVFAIFFLLEVSKGWGFLLFALKMYAKVIPKVIFFVLCRNF